ncbi:hypothetical protein BH10ACT2_BH10ACT2_21270 [soil metagenome]
MRPIELKGGIANAGSVVRVGAHVLRPSNRHTPTIHRFLTTIANVDFTGASQPIGVDDDGRERLHFISGDVPIPPFPKWAQTDDVLSSIARLMRRFHDASRQFKFQADDTWSDEMVDPDGGLLVCHNDVCLENVVFRDGEAVGLLDFDFAAPGRAEYDLACFARMCVPIDDDESRSRLGWLPADLPTRLRLVADEYGLDSEGRREVLAALDGTIERGGQFVLRRVEAGDPNFIAMWNGMGGMARFDRRRDWWAATRPQFESAMR